MGLPWCLSACNAGNPGSIHGSGRSHGEGNGNPSPHFCLRNSMDRGAWQAIVHGVAESQTWLSDWQQQQSSWMLAVSLSSGGWATPSSKHPNGEGHMTRNRTLLPRQVNLEVHSSAPAANLTAHSWEILSHKYSLKFLNPETMWANTCWPFGRRSLVGCSPWGR